MEDGEINRADLESFFRDLETYRMPFGKYGPDHFAPEGVPLIDLPDEYLQWFQQQGWPGGRLGELMEMVWEIKKTGADPVFNPLRQKRGGRTSLRPKRPDHFKFD